MPATAKTNKNMNTKKKINAVNAELKPLKCALNLCLAKESEDSQFTDYQVRIYGIGKMSGWYVFRKAWLSGLRDFKYIHKTCNIKEELSEQLPPTVAGGQLHNSYTTMMLYQSSCPTHAVSGVHRYAQCILILWIHSQVLVNYWVSISTWVWVKLWPSV